MMKLIDTAGGRKGWTYTPSLRGTEKKLTASLINPTLPGRGPSMEKMTYNAGEPFIEDGESEANDGSISLGSFIETRR
jgi:hypothetical protein